MISVVIPVYNAAATIDACIEALLCQSVPRTEYEIIVVDDGSLDRTREVVGRYVQQHNVKLVSQSNQGPGAARNYGVSEARGEIVLFTDADCAPTANWIEEMVKPFDDPEIVGVKGAYQTSQGELIARFVQIEYEGKYDKVRKDQYIDFIDTYAAGYRKTVMEQHGSFDPSLQRSEDVDFSHRLADMGYKMVFVPQAIVYHQHVDSVGGYVHRKFWVGFWRAARYRKLPHKMLHDSHTPQTLKVQVGLTGLLVPFSLGAFLSREFLKWVILLLSSFFLSTLPFCFKALKKDLQVGFIAPALLFVRAIALGAGFVTGVITQVLASSGLRHAAQ